MLLFLRLMYFLKDALNHWTSVARRFEKNELDLFDIPRYRDELILILKALEKSPLGVDDIYDLGFEQKFLTSN